MCVCVSLCTPSTNTCTHSNVCLSVALHTSTNTCTHYNVTAICISTVSDFYQCWRTLLNARSLNSPLTLTSHIKHICLYCCFPITFSCLFVKSIFTQWSIEPQKKSILGKWDTVLLHVNCERVHRSVGLGKFEIGKNKWFVNSKWNPGATYGNTNLKTYHLSTVRDNIMSPCLLIGIETCSNIWSKYKLVLCQSIRR